MFARFCGLLTLEDGRPFELEAFQRRMLADYFAGSTETLVLISKKNGKSTLASALALYHLVTTPDAECVIAAASRDQAAILFGQAAGFIRRNPGLQQRMQATRREIRSLRDSGRIRVMASDVDTADGVIPTLALVDELHRHKSADLYGVFRDGLGPRAGRMITISTAGDDEESPLGKMRRAALELPLVERDGTYTYARSADGAYVMHEWALGHDADVHDMRVVKRANPASWQTVEALRRRHDSPSMQPWQWQRFACGIWAAGEDSAISPKDWAACAGPVTFDADRPVWVGVDLGWKRDCTAIVPVQARDDDVTLVGEPVILTPPGDGTSLRVDQVMGALRGVLERWDVEAVVLDPNRDGEHVMQTLEADGVRVVEHSQDPSPMSLAAQRLSTAVTARRLVHPDHPALTAHVLAAQAKVVDGDKWRLVKGRRSRPIDAVIALAMVHSVMTSASLTPMFGWASR